MDVDKHKSVSYVRGRSSRTVTGKGYASPAASDVHVWPFSGAGRREVQRETPPGVPATTQLLRQPRGGRRAEIGGAAQ